MIETLTDQERRRLISLAVAAVPATYGDPELTNIIAKLVGVDTVIRVVRAYPSLPAITAAALNKARR